MLNPVKKFLDDRQKQISGYSNDDLLIDQSQRWLETSMNRRYVYNFDWLGRPIIQYPQDMVALQEIVWATRPDLIIETGVAHGGSLILSASLLAMLDYCDAVQSAALLDPKASKRKVLGIDIDIRSHNKDAIEAHPLSHMIDLIQGSSIEPEVISSVRSYANNFKRVMICLDSNHTTDHVFAELNAYGDLTSKGCYCVVFDTFVNDMSSNLFPDRPWGPNNNPKIAVHKFLEINSKFVIDKSIHEKLQITVAPDGYLIKIT